MMLGWSISMSDLFPKWLWEPSCDWCQKPSSFFRLSSEGPRGSGSASPGPHSCTPTHGIAALSPRRCVRPGGLVHAPGPSQWKRSCSQVVQCSGNHAVVTCPVDVVRHEELVMMFRKSEKTFSGGASLRSPLPDTVCARALALRPAERHYLAGGDATDMGLSARAHASG